MKGHGVPYPDDYINEVFGTETSPLKDVAAPKSAYRTRSRVWGTLVISCILPVNHAYVSCTSRNEIIEVNFV